MSVQPCLLVALLVLVSCASWAVGQPQTQPDFFVATNGADTNPGTRDRPFATLVRARDAVRELKKTEPARDLLVLVGDGVYWLTEPLVFGPQDSGAGTFSITYAAAPDAKPVISGGRAIAGWQRGAGNVWTADLPEVKAGRWFFRQLFVNDARAVRCRYPNDGQVLKVAAVSPDIKTISFSTPLVNGDLGGQDAELVVFQHWSITRGLITSSTEKGVVTATPHGWIGHGESTTTSVGKSAYLEHAKSFLDQPGEWFLDRASGELSYVGAPGQDVAKLRFIAPVLEQWLVVSGTKAQPVRNLRFQGLCLAYAEFPLPKIGYAEIQAGHYGPSIQAATHVPPVAIECVYAEDCRFEACRFAHTGAAAIGFGPGCKRNAINGCRIEDIGGNGVMVGWRGKGELQSDKLDADWKDPSDAPVGQQVTNNMIQRCGAVSHGSVGVFAAFAPDTRIAHNLIRNMPYTGISIGFRWNPSDTTMKNCVVECNHIHDVMGMLADGGGVYSLGYQPGTILRGNNIHDVRRGANAVGAPNNGFFVDEGSKGFLFERNLVYATSGGEVRFNNCQQDWHTWKDNLFGGRVARAKGRVGQALVCNGGALEVAHEAALEPEQITVSAWVWLTEYPAGEDNRRWVVNKNGNEWSQGHYGLVVAGKEVGAFLNIGGGRDKCFEARSDSAPLKLKQWHNLAVTYDSATLRVYVDGAEVAAKAVNQKRQAGTAPLAIGRRQDGFANSAFRGLIDEVRVYNRAMDAAQVKVLAESPEKAPADGLARAWTFDEPNGGAADRIVSEAGLEPAFRKTLLGPEGEE